MIGGIVELKTLKKGQIAAIFKKLEGIEGIDCSDCAEAIAGAASKDAHSQIVEWLEKHRLKWSTGLTLTIGWQDWQEFKKVE